MLDNLRDQASSSPFFQEQEPLPEQQEEALPAKRSLDQIIGMNAQQRFIIALMLLMIVCVLGVMLLVVTGRMSLPFLS
jgi:hypothetical protein